MKTITDFLKKFHSVQKFFTSKLYQIVKNLYSFFFSTKLRMIYPKVSHGFMKIVFRALVASACYRIPTLPAGT
jgi:hypothetical protein